MSETKKGGTMSTRKSMGVVGHFRVGFGILLALLMSLAWRAPAVG